MNDKNRVGKKIGAKQPKHPICSVPLGGYATSKQDMGKKEYQNGSGSCFPKGDKAKVYK